ncbi:alpha/beta hydrolase family protein [Aureispira anguillae]|uniref:Alpha/beta hydrolase n=1 Tax=Aureispira anguillae TaxID=2864201 RepID=A0A916DTM6_9BACT|nr:hypothetical protein [Aureispira anguillae]BDS12666.1 hypothetical protein AsAng_0033900 [Aureispira anguillae]
MRQIFHLCIFIGICVFFIACSSPSKEVSQSQQSALKKWLALAPNARPDLSKEAFATNDCSSEEIKTALQLLCTAQQQQDASTLEKGWKEKVFQYKTYKMPFKIKTFGKAPKDGRSLFISMHGGGGTLPEVNDQQWENQIRLYQPKEGVYIAPRAPTNSWNLWHQAHIDPLLDQLIKAAVLFANVNPNKVYLTGYSAGGDGTFQLAPRMADRFAAAAMMAGHPNETTPDGLRNLPFAIFMGALDSAYHRNQLAKDWNLLLDSLQNLDPQGYKHHVQVVEGKGHWMDRVDTSGINWMMQFTRNPIPKKIVWKQDDCHQDRFYWLKVPTDKIETGKRIVVERQQNTIHILENYSSVLNIGLNDQMVNLDQPIIIQYQGKVLFEAKIPRTILNLHQSLTDRMDQHLAFCSQVFVLDNNKVSLKMPSAK